MTIKPIPRKGASSHRTKSSKRNTKHKPKDKKEEIKKDKKQQFADDQEQINYIHKEAKGFWNYLRNKKKNKICED